MKIKVRDYQASDFEVCCSLLRELTHAAKRFAKTLIRDLGL